MGSLPELPDEVIYKIVSDHLSLTEKEAIRLSLVSKDFSRALRSRRILVFDEGCREEIKSLRSTLLKYFKENIGLEKFQFRGNQSKSERLIIAVATMLSPKILILRLVYNDLEQSVFGAESVVELSLEWCCLRPRGMILWSNLKRLRLEGVLMVDGAWEKMSRSSPLLEILQIYWCLGTPLCLSFKHSCPNLKILSLGGFLTDYHGFLTDFEHKFPQLQVLHIDLSSGLLRRINISSRSLKEIQLLRMDDLHEAHFDVPNVVHFAYSNGDGTDSIIPKLSFKGNSSGRISFKCKADADFSWFLKMREFLAELNSSETSVTVSFQGGVSFSEPDAVPSPAILGAIKDLSVEGFPPVSAKPIIEAIFWTCLPQTIKFTHFGDSEDDPRDHHSIQYLQEVTCEDVFLKLSEALANRNNGPFTLECRRSGDM